MINNATILGRVGKDPEFHADGKLAMFSVATTESWKNKEGEWQEKTEWHNIKCWQGLADSIRGRVVKGALVFIQGSIASESWDGDDGVKRVTVSIRAYKVRVISKPAEAPAAAPVATPENNDGLPF